MSKRSILIVEDEGIVAEDLAGVLRHMGHEVAGITATGEEAVELARRLRPALILMDIHLAGAMDGIAAAQQIHRECQLPVIFLTAHSDPSMIMLAQQTAALGYILKPFDERDLRIQIEMALVKHAAEQQLRESDKRLALAMSAAQIDMFGWDLNSGSILWTQTHETIFSPTSSDATAPSTIAMKQDYRRLADRAHPEEPPPLVKETSDRCVQDNKPLEVQHWITWPDGSVHWIETKGVFCKTTGIQPTDNPMLGVAMESTERKQAAEESRLAEQTLSEVIKHSPFGTYIVNAQFRIVQMNTASQVGAFRKVRPVIGRPFDEAMRILWPEDVAAEIIGHFRQTLDTGDAYYSHDFIKPRHNSQIIEAYEWELHRMMLPDGQYGVICYYFDSSKLRATDDELRKSARRDRDQGEELATILDAVPTPVIIIHDPEATHMTGNRAADELLQQPSGAEISLSAHLDVKPIHFKPVKDGRELTLDELPAQRAARGEHVRDFEFDLVFNDGTTRHLLSYGKPLMDEQSRPRGAVHVLIDITERKLAEEQLHKSLAEKEVMLREIHHRVKNNLQVISSLISLQAADQTDERMRDEFNDVRDRVRSMALIHEKLYQASNLTELNFADYAANLLGSLWRSHGKLAEKVRLNLKIAPVLLPIESAVPCGLILNELVVNALKHAFPTGCDGEVTVTMEHPSADTVCLRVRDNGVGLSADLDWRHPSSLGLRLVQILAVQLHGTVDTGIGPGAEFQITFPLSKAQP